ncbi:polymeric immunoglobulin receptor-like isoform X3 [Betta splendens]|uniref:polymeric immunoglobulin receptor-like isoform X3 n=1 Tax=Betta splendens TaxID=158456 RepID=UPI00244DB359|nr:polymeric immunoglobulin receptor-like isoform X3 [Betta splendens]
MLTFLLCCNNSCCFIFVASPCFVSSKRPLIHVFGYEGREAKVSCSYDAGYEDYEKYLCRNDCGSNDVLITTTEAKKNRFTISDDINKKVFTTTISNLQYSDAGKYWCGVTISGILEDFYPAEVRLQVVKDTCCDNSTKVPSSEGGSVSFTCSYESRYQNNLKYMCRGNRPSTCLQQAVVSSIKKQDTRFTLTDDKLSTFTVNITSLTQQDSGSYLCGVHTNTGLDVFSAVDLEVKEWCCVKSNKLRSSMGHPITMQCPYPPQHGANRKFLCKGDHHRNCTDMMTDTRFTLLDNVSTSSFLVMVSELAAGDSGTYWCGSDSHWSFGNYTNIQLSVDVAAFNVVVFIVPAVLVFVLIFVMVMVCKHKCHKGKATGANVETTQQQHKAGEISESDIYENQDVVVSSKQRKSKQQNSCSRYDAGGAEQDLIANLHLFSCSSPCSLLSLQIKHHCPGRFLSDLVSLSISIANKS